MSGMRKKRSIEQGQRIGARLGLRWRPDWRHGIGSFDVPKPQKPWLPLTKTLNFSAAIAGFVLHRDSEARGFAKRGSSGVLTCADNLRHHLELSEPAF